VWARQAPLISGPCGRRPAHALGLLSSRFDDVPLSVPEDGGGVGCKVACEIDYFFA
jgi:hypothetical protein